MTPESTVSAGWWSDADVDEVEEWLTGRGQSRLWQLTDPATLARWVFADPTPAPLVPAPAVLARDWWKGLDGRQLLSWALVGYVIRMAVPEAVSTAGVGTCPDSTWATDHCCG